MEENKEVSTTETTTEEVGTQANENKDEGTAEVKTFTQEQVNAMIAKEKKKMPSKDELKAFNDWKESQKTEAEKQAEKETNYQKALSDLSDRDKTIAVLRAGVKSDDEDYVLFKVGKMEGDFNENLAKFLEQNPKYLGQGLTTEQKATGAPVTTISSNQTTGVAAILKAKHPELFKS